MPTLQRACATADIDLSELDGIAVTAGPGLMGALVVGLAAAKALAYALDKPLYGVNHLAGHVAVDLLEHGPLPRPLRRAAGVRRPHLAAARSTDVATEHHRARLDHRRRGRRGVRQGGPAAGAALSGRAAHRPGGGRRRSGRGPLPARPDRAEGPGAAPVRLLLLRAEDRGGPVGRDRASGRAGRSRSPTWRPASRRRSATCSAPRPWTPARRPVPTDLLIGGGVAANRRLRELLAERSAASRGRAADAAARPVHRQRRDDRRARRRGRDRGRPAVGAGHRRRLLAAGQPDPAI